ncbi:MAG: TetR/AcrR family transcriptional regulator [Phycisphaerae bacterium]|nr:TetR/AcrR family transcriptional regulator [Phycisphaerae bacterium]
MAKRDRRADIMRAAEKLFTSRRFHEITLDHVVDEAGVGKGTVYRYFRDKDDLFFQIATHGFDELCDLLTERPPRGGSFSARLLENCRRISEFFVRRRQLFGMMQSEEDRMRWCDGDLRERWVQRRKKLVAAVAKVLRDGVAEGAVRKDIPADIQATFLLGLLRTRARDLADAAESWRKLELLVDFFLRGAASGAPAGSRVRKSVTRARLA